MGLLRLLECDPAAYDFRISVFLLVALAAGYLVFTGPHHLDRYPPPASSPYRLPWQTRVAIRCESCPRAASSPKMSPAIEITITSSSAREKIG